MTPFEFGFALLSLLLGLGFAAVADSAARLILAGKFVRWDWLSPIVALNVFQTGLIYWWFQWSLRDQPLMLADLCARAFACLLIYVLSVAALPQPIDGKADLVEHFDRSRRLINGGFFVYTALVAYVLPAMAGRGLDPGWGTPSLLIAFATGMFVRNRWVQTGIQVFALCLLGADWLLLSIRA